MPSAAVPFPSIRSKISYSSSMRPKTDPGSVLAGWKVGQFVLIKCPSCRNNVSLVH